MPSPLSRTLWTTKRGRIAAAAVSASALLVLTSCSLGDTSSTSTSAAAPAATSKASTAAGGSTAASGSAAAGGGAEGATSDWGGRAGVGAVQLRPCHGRHQTRKRETKGFRGAYGRAIKSFGRQAMVFLERRGVESVHTTLEVAKIMVYASELRTVLLGGP